MRLHGYCTGCHRIKPVRVTSASMSRMAAMGNRVPTGLCATCEEAADKRRTR